MRPGTAKKPRVLLVDSNARTRTVLRQILLEHAHSIHVAATASSAVEHLANGDFDVVIIDVDHLGSEAALSLAASSIDPAVRWIIISEQSIPDRVLDAPFVKLRQPFDAAQLIASLHDTVVRQSEAVLRRRLIGRSAAMTEMFKLIETLAPTRATVLITGETGTGKEVVARTIHELSDRAKHHFVPVTCSALPETLLESELFGHVRGSFTGAIANRRGLFEDAAGGTLFLDEISTISPAIQVKLLRVLQEKRIQRVGSGADIPVDFRLIAATNVDLAEEVAAGRFRQDLFYRLNVVPVRVPPLRERAGDIPLLVSHFRLHFARENGLPAPAIDTAALARMSAYNWPGNVRELEHFVERAVIMQASTPELVSQLPESRMTAQGLATEAMVDEPWTLDRLERAYILEVLRSCGGNRKLTARKLGIATRTLYRKLKLYGS